MLLASSNVEYWENPEIISENKLPPHATLIPFDDLEKALTFKKENSSRIKSLNGLWKFNWAPKPDDRPLEFFMNETELTDWTTIKGPSSWQMEGFGQPIYTNIKHPFPFPNPPFPPKNNNPVGSYKRYVNLPENWKNGLTIIHFGGVKSAFFLWINGKKVGYSQGSMTPAEFDITDYLRSGKNSVSAQVFRWSDASYIEDQDFWRLSGIYRDVFLVNLPESHIQHYKVDAKLKNKFKIADLGCGEASLIEILNKNYLPKNVYGEGHLKYYSNMLDVLEGKDEAICSGDDALSSIKIICAAHKSFNEKRIIDLNTEID